MIATYICILTVFSEFPQKRILLEDAAIQLGMDFDTRLCAPESGSIIQ